MSCNKIKIQLKETTNEHQICSEGTTKKKISLKPKVAQQKQPIRLKQTLPNLPEGIIDLKQYYLSTQKNKSQQKKEIIIDVLNQLVEHTEDQIKSTTGSDRKKHQFRSTQFKKAIATLQSHPFEITSRAQAKKLPGIGNGIADRIDEILKTGTLAELSKKIVEDDETKLINQLTQVTGIGEAHARKFILMGITGVQDLFDKAAIGSVKVTHHMQVGLKYFNDFKQRIPFEEILRLSSRLRSLATELYPDIILEVAGSHRRKLPTSGDMDVLITHPDIQTEDDLIQSTEHHLQKIVEKLRKSGYIIADLTSKGDTKYMGVTNDPDVNIGRRIDIRFVPFDSYYPALLYFTGSKTTNKLMRTIALEKGYTLNEYCLCYCKHGEKGAKVVANSEEEIFEILGIKYLDPPDREL